MEPPDRAPHTMAKASEEKKEDDKPIVVIAAAKKRKKVLTSGQRALRGEWCPVDIHEVSMVCTLHQPVTIQTIFDSFGIVPLYRRCAC